MRLIYLTLILIFFTACKKADPKPEINSGKHILITENYTDQEFDSGGYLMAKPGSWWEYTNGEIWTCESKDTVPIYELDSELHNAKLITKDRSIVPSHPFFGPHKNNYGILNKSYHDETIFQPIYDTVVGQFYEYEKYVNSVYISQKRTITEKREVLEVLDSMEVNYQMYYDVLHVRHHIRTYYHGKDYGYVPDDIMDFYLAKNVGLIKMNHQDGTSYHQMELTDYFIT